MLAHRYQEGLFLARSSPRKQHRDRYFLHALYASLGRGLSNARLGRDCNCERADSQHLDMHNWRWPHPVRTGQGPARLAVESSRDPAAVCTHTLQSRKCYPGAGRRMCGEFRRCSGGQMLCRSPPEVLPPWTLAVPMPQSDLAT